MFYLSLYTLGVETLLRILTFICKNPDRAFISQVLRHNIDQLQLWVRTGKVVMATLSINNILRAVNFLRPIWWDANFRSCSILPVRLHFTRYASFPQRLLLLVRGSYCSTFFLLCNWEGLLEEWEMVRPSVSGTAATEPECNCLPTSVS